MKYLITAFSVLVLFAFTTAAQIKTNFTQQDYAKFFKPASIPKDLKDNGHILLVMTPFKTSDEKKNNEIKAIFDTYYKGKFVVIYMGAGKEAYQEYDNNLAVYRYSVLINQANSPFANSEGHVHYEINIIDNVKLHSGPNREAIKDSMSQANGGKKVKEKDVDKYIETLPRMKSIESTGLEDAPAKLIRMLTFFVQQL